jgi:tetratricopeptide (TPR) repeat protein
VEAVVVTAVAGLAGVGKTALAVQAGHAALVQGWFAGGVLFVDLHGYDEEPVQPLQALDAFLRALRVPAQEIPPGVEERAALYRSTLAQVVEPVLVIADNASSEAQVRLLLPGIGRHRVLVTSRHTLAGLDARLVDVTVFDDAAGMELLDAALRAARPDDDRISCAPEVAGRLARLCGGLPLALQITAAMLKADPELMTGELAERLSDEGERLQALRYDDGSGASAPSVAAALELSYRGLDDVSARVFRLLSVAPGPDVSTDAITVMVGLPVEKARTVLHGLIQAHLVEHAPQSAERWRMHDLVRMHAQQRSDEHAVADKRSQAQGELLDYYRDVARVADMLVRGLPLPGAPGTLPERAQALAWFDAERASLLAAAIIAASLGRNEVAFDLPILMAEYLDWRRQFDDKLIACDVSRDAACRLGDKVGEAMALNGMSTALRETGRLEEALTASEDAVAAFRKYGHKQYEGLALLNLGNTLVKIGRLEEAIAVQENAAGVFAETGDRTGESMAMGNLGIALYRASRFEDAITAEQNMAAISRESGDQHREAMALNNLGHALRGLGRLEEAITAHRGSAAFFHKTGDPHGQTDALNNLAAALDEAGRFEETITVYRDLAALFRETGNRTGEGEILNTLAVTLKKVQQVQEAITVYRDLAARSRETGNRTDEGMALTNLGAALIDEQQFEEAITASLRAAEIFREIGDRSGEGTALNNMGHALTETRQFEEAVTACQDAVDIFRQIGHEAYERAALKNLERARRAN